MNYLGRLISDSEVQFCETSIISQCINPMVVRKKCEGKDAGKGGPPQINDIEAYANHVVKFSLAGIQAIRKTAEGKKSVMHNVMNGQRDKNRRPGLLHRPAAIEQARHKERGKGSRQVRVDESPGVLAVARSPRRLPDARERAGVHGPSIPGGREASALIRFHEVQRPERSAR